MSAHPLLDDAASHLSNGNHQRPAAVQYRSSGRPERSCRLRKQQAPQSEDPVQEPEPSPKPALVRLPRVMQTTEDASSSSSDGGLASSSGRSTPPDGMDASEFDAIVDDNRSLSSGGEDNVRSDGDDRSGTPIPSKRSKKHTGNSGKRARARPPVPAARPVRARRPSTANGEDNSTDTDPSTSSRVPNIKLTIQPEDLVGMRMVAEGQMGVVMLAEYLKLPVACKSRRRKKSRQSFEKAIRRELEFATRLSACRSMNTIIGILSCPRRKLGLEYTRTGQPDDLFIVQRYYRNGDLRDYIERQRGDYFHELEVLFIGVSLFAGLADAHRTGIGLVDVKLENILVDDVGCGWFTDFGSCVELQGEKYVHLDDAGVQWTRSVAAPEMLADSLFCQKSDVFMCAWILAEMMTPGLNDQEFADQVLRRAKNGTVHLDRRLLHPMYRSFVPILERALQNDVDKRPSAQQVFDTLSEMRRLSLYTASKRIVSLETPL